MSVLEDAFYGSGWDESEHPRVPAGEKKGGQFTVKQLEEILAMHERNLGVAQRRRPSSTAGPRGGVDHTRRLVERQLAKVDKARAMLNQALTVRALESWVGSPETMRLHMANEINGEDPGEGPGARMRQEAAALLHAVREGGANDRTLYRGARSLDNRLGVPESWTEKRSVAKRFAGKDGQVFKLGPGEARGIRVRDYISSGMDMQDGGQWLIDPLSRAQTAAGWDETKHPRFEAGRREGGRFRPTVEWLDTALSKLGHANMQNRVPWIYDPDLKKLFVGSPASDHSELSKKIYEVYGYDNALFHEWTGVWVPGQGAVLHGNETGDLPSVDFPLPPELAHVVKRAFNENLKEYDTEQMGASAWAPLSAAGWDETKHPRHPRGEQLGGKFAPKTTVEVIENLDYSMATDVRRDAILEEVKQWPDSTPDGDPKTYAIAAINEPSDLEEGGLIVVRRDGKLIGVGDFVDTGFDQLDGGSFGAIEGGGLPLFSAFLDEAARRDYGASWIAGNERAKQLYDRLGLPLENQPSQAEYEEYGDRYSSYEQYLADWEEEFGNSYRLTPEQVKLLADDMFALARSRTAAVEAMVAAGWDENEHPRDPGGDQGGQFIPKGGMAVDDAPVMGLGPPGEEEKVRKQNAVPPEVERQMEADLKDFLDNADLSMRVPEEAMLEILNDGEFYNQHQAGSSRGLQRDPKRELEIFGLTDPAGLPKYGYLGPDHSGVVSYGPMKVVFKDDVKDRATFTVNDSLVYGGAVVPSPVRDPSYLSANLSQIDEVMTAAMPGDMYDPTSGELQGMNLRYGSEDFTPDGSLWSDAIANEATSIPYVEAQIYGKLTLDDIERVEVPREEDWDLEDPLTGLPQIGDQEAFRRAITELEKRGVTVSTYEVPGDYSGEWA